MHEVVPRLVETLASPTKVSHEFGHKPATETLLYPLLTYDPKKRNVETYYLIQIFDKTYEANKNLACTQNGTTILCSLDIFGNKMYFSDCSININ